MQTQKSSIDPNPAAHVNQTAAVRVFFSLTRQQATTPTAFSATVAHLILSSGF
uniref:Uncharacterized protein n=1 Tax=Solanum tuberosum TaxID=4113 RepID=M1BZ98_SOLTU